MSRGWDRRGRERDRVWSWNHRCRREQGSWKSATFSRADEGSIEGPTSKGEREWGAHETQREGLSRIPTPQPHFIGSGSPRVRGPGSPLFARVGQVFGGVARRRFLFPSHAPRYHVKLACQLPSPPLFPHAHTHTHALAPHPVAACPHETPRHTTPLDQCGGPPKGEGPSVAQG